MTTMLHVMRNILRVTFRRRSSYVIYIALPVLGVLLASVILAGSSGQFVRVAIVNNDAGEFGSNLADDVSSWGSYHTTVVAPGELDRQIAAGRYDCGLIIPADFTTSVRSGNIDTLQLVSIKGASVTAALQALLQQYATALAEISTAANGDPGTFDALYSSSRTNGIGVAAQEVKDESAIKSATSTGIGYFVLFILLGASLTSQLVLAEKQNGTYSRVISGPIRPRGYIAANGLAGFLIILIQIVLVLVLMRYVVHLAIFVPVVPLALVLVFFGFVSVALGLLAVAFASSSAAATAIETLILTPSCMLAGCFWPVSIMPQFMQKLALFMPQRWVLDALDKLQSGHGPASILVNLAVLATFAVTLFLVATFGFSRKESAGQFV